MTAPAQALKGGKLSRQCAMLCQSEAFRHWLDARRKLVTGAHNEAATREWFLAACKITSRAEIDHNEYAGKMFRKIMRTYMSEQPKVPQ